MGARSRRGSPVGGVWGGLGAGLSGLGASAGCPRGAGGRQRGSRSLVVLPKVCPLRPVFGWGEAGACQQGRTASFREDVLAALNNA